MFSAPLSAFFLLACPCTFQLSALQPLSYCAFRSLTSDLRPLPSAPAPFCILPSSFFIPSIDLSPRTTQPRKEHRQSGGDSAREVCQRGRLRAPAVGGVSCPARWRNPSHARPACLRAGAEIPEPALTGIRPPRRDSLVWSYPCSYGDRLAGKQKLGKQKGDYLSAEGFASLVGGCWL